MGYQKDHVAVLGSEEAFDLLASTYREYHQRLEARARDTRKRCLPRSLQGIHLLEIGCGDGRIAKKIENEGIARYIACDISKNMLTRLPSSLTPCHIDMTNEVLPYEDDSFDIVLCMAVISYMDDLLHCFTEAFRILKSGGRMIITQHKERRSAIYKVHNKAFKIIMLQHTIDEVRDYAEEVGFEVDVWDDEEDLVVYCLTK